MMLLRSFVVRVLRFSRERLAFDPVLLVRVRRPTGGLERLGSAECGWIVPRGAPGSGALCYCFGAGEDITFDVALRLQRGCIVHTFDPTPRAVRHHQGLPEAARSAVSFHSLGIWVEDKTMTFFPPSDGRHVSHSIVNLQGTTGGFKAECLTPASIMARLGHTAPPELVKMDIEGAEMVVLPVLMDSMTLPAILLVEFDELSPLWKLATWGRVRRMGAMLLKRGYQLASVKETNYTFILCERRSVR